MKKKKRKKPLILSGGGSKGMVNVRSAIGISNPGPVKIYYLDFTVDMNKENREKAKGILGKINDHINSSWRGNKNYLVEDKVLKRLFSQYWACCPDELQAGVLSNRPTPLLEYMRSGLPTEQNKKTGQPLPRLEKFLGKNRRYEKQDAALAKQMIFRLKHPYWRYKVGSLVSFDSSWDDLYENSLRFNPSRAKRLRADTPAMFLGIKTMFVCTDKFASHSIAHKDYDRDFPAKRNMLATHNRMHWSRAYKDVLLERIGKNETFMSMNSVTDELGTFVKAIEPILRTEEEVLKINERDHERIKKNGGKKPWEIDEKGGAISLAILQYTENINKAMSHLRKNASVKRKTELLDEMFHRIYINKAQECITNPGELESAIGLLATSQDNTDRINYRERVGHYKYGKSRSSGYSDSLRSLSSLFRESDTLNKMIGGVWGMTLCPTVLYTRVKQKEMIGLRHIKGDAFLQRHRSLMWAYKTNENELCPRTYCNMKGRIDYDVAKANLAHTNDSFNSSYKMFEMMDEDKYIEKMQKEKRSSLFVEHPMESIRDYDGMVAFFQTWYQDGKIIYENVPSCFCIEHDTGHAGNSVEIPVMSSDKSFYSSLAMTPEERIEAGYPEKIWFQKIFDDW